jgi:hypothetical protein
VQKGHGGQLFDGGGKLLLGFTHYLGPCL